MKFSMTGLENSDLLIEVTAWAGLTEILTFISSFGTTKPQPSSQWCIQEWLTRQPTCPVDRNPITPNQLKPVPRILRNLLSRLQITCDNVGYGCAAVIKLDMLAAHLQECEHNPKKHNYLL
jgi:hypothetical protein